MSLTVRPDRKPTLAQRIAAEIRDAITDARFEFGEALSEETLAGAFDVSRTPIREALNLLQMEGLVTIVPKSGTYIFTPTLEDIGALCDFRAGLELQALDLALDTAPHELSADLRGIADGMSEAVSRGDMRAYGRLDQKYHQAIVDRAGNPYLSKAYAMIVGRVSALRTHLAAKAEGEPQRSMADHRRFPDLVHDADREAARSLLSDHIRHTKSNYLTAFRKRDADTGDESARLRALFSVWRRKRG